MLENLRPDAIEVGDHRRAVAHEQEFDQAARDGISAVDRLALQLDGGGVEEILDEFFEGLFLGAAGRIAGLSRLPSEGFERVGTFILRHGKTRCLIAAEQR